MHPTHEPYARGMLAVSSIHTLYWEESGNPNGIPAVFVHGGPGGGTEPAHRGFFDAESRPPTPSFGKTPPGIS